MIKTSGECHGWGKPSRPILTTQVFCKDEQQCLTTDSWRRAACLNRSGVKPIEVYVSIKTDSFQSHRFILIVSLADVQDLPVDLLIIHLWQVIWVLLNVWSFFIPHCFSRPVCLGISICRERSQKHNARERCISKAQKLWPELQAHRTYTLSHAGTVAAFVAQRAPAHFILRPVEPRGLSASTGFSFLWLIPPVSFCFEAHSHGHLFTMECVLSLSFSRRWSTYLTSKSSFD